MRNKFVVIVGILLALSLVLAGCAPAASPTQPAGGATQAPGSTSQPGNTPAGETVTIEMKNIQYVPAEVTIKAGTTVTWVNKDNLAHTVDSGTRDNPTTLFKSGNLGPGQTFSYTFTTPGTYPYFCEPHQAMNGTITVTQ